MNKEVKPMLEVIFRIYEIDHEQDYDYKKELCMDCYIANDREHFKDIIRNNYGEDIKFRGNRNMKNGELVCVIIAENCYNTEQYFNKVEYKCNNCNTKISSYVDKHIYISDWEISNYLFNKKETYSTHKFCSRRCKELFIENERKVLKPDMEDEYFVTRDMYVRNGVVGYIYKITKKSTDEFYIGQSKYVPMFRWVQHLDTERFNIKNIDDYMFEILYVVKESEDILEIERKFIKDNLSEKCLNKVHNNLRNK